MSDDRRTSLATRLVVAGGSILLVVIAVQAAVGGRRQAQRLTAAREASALAMATLVARGIEGQLADPAAMERELDRACATAEALGFGAFRENGTLLAASAGFRDLAVHAPTAAGQRLAQRIGDQLRIETALGRGTLVGLYDLSAARRASSLDAALTIALAALAFALGLWLLRRHALRLSERLLVLERDVVQIASGDLSASPRREGDDEISHLAERLEGMKANLRVLVGEIRNLIDEIRRRLQSTFAFVQSQEEVASTEAVAIEETQRTMSTLLESSKLISESAGDVLSRIERTLENSRATRERFEMLAARIDRINEILDLIRDISRRSELLALNAALEGSRAGEAGKGFSLVAAELQRLSESVAQRVQDIRALVEDIRGSAHSVSETSAEAAKIAGEATESARQIRHVTRQQQNGTEQVNYGLASSAAMIAGSNTAAREATEAIAILSELAASLLQVVSAFRDGREPPTA